MSEDIAAGIINVQREENKRQRAIIERKDMENAELRAALTAEKAAREKNHEIYQTERAAWGRERGEATETHNRLHAERVALREENARLREALETARCALDSPTFPRLNGSETAKAVRDALAAPTPEKEATCSHPTSKLAYVNGRRFCGDCGQEDPGRATPEHPEREDSTPNAPKVTGRETKGEETEECLHGRMPPDEHWDRHGCDADECNRANSIHPEPQE